MLEVAGARHVPGPGLGEVVRTIAGLERLHAVSRTPLVGQLQHLRLPGVRARLDLRRPLGRLGGRACDRPRSLGGGDGEGEGGGEQSGEQSGGAHGASLCHEALPNGDARASRWNRRRCSCQGEAVSSRADVAVIGGSGFYSFLDDARAGDRRDAVRRPVGAGLGRRGGRPAGGVPAAARAGTTSYPPHLINYRANLWALRSLGVRQVLAPCAVGGLRAEVAPGDLVVPDQLVDRTSGRAPTLRRARRRAPAVRRPLLPAAVRRPWPQPDGVRRGGTMVVIDGPRFSTRAESQDYAAARLDADQHDRRTRGGAGPRAADVLAAIALVTDMDAGAEAGAGRAARRTCSRCSRSNTERLKALLAGVIADLPDPAGCTCATWADGLDARPTRSREGPAHRVGRVHRLARSTAPLAARGDEVVRRRPDAAGGARRRPSAPPGTHPLDVRDAGAVGRPARRRRRGLPPGRAGRARRPTSPTCPSYASHNDLGTAALLAAMHEAGVDRLVLASSMVVYGEGRYACPTHGPPGARRRGPRRALAAGRLREPVPGLRRAARLGAGRRGRAARPAQRLRRQQGRPGALRRGVGAAGRRRGGGAALPQRLRPGDAAGHAVLRRRGDVPLLGRARRAAAGLRGRRPDARLRARRRRGAGQPARR